jgi:transposase
MPSRLPRSSILAMTGPPIGVLPRRWIVERTFSWLSQNRRMSKDYERLPGSVEAFIYVAMSRLMVRRLARS